MRQWRVGTLSMGLLLVLTGIGLLLAQFNMLAVIDFGLKWWPIIFILLGLEVLALNYFHRDGNSRVKYDLFSVVITLLIILTGLGIQSLTQLGLVAEARTMISSQVFAVQDSSEIPLEAGIDKLVLITGDNPVNIHSSQGNSIIANSTLQIRAQSQLEAQATASQRNSIFQQRSANTLYIELQPNKSSEPVTDCSYTLIIPDNLSVKIDGSNSSLNIDLASLQNDWEIDGTGICAVNLPARVDLTVNALVENQAALQGNLAWTTAKIGAASNPALSPEPIGVEQVQTQAKLGAGSHKMNLLGMRELTINCLP